MSSSEARQRWKAQHGRCQGTTRKGQQCQNQSLAAEGCHPQDCFDTIHFVPGDTDRCRVHRDKNPIALGIKDLCENLGFKVRVLPATGYHYGMVKAWQPGNQRGTVEIAFGGPRGYIRDGWIQFSPRKAFIGNGRMHKEDSLLELADPACFDKLEALLRSEWLDDTILAAINDALAEFHKASASW
jgi:hypothetical protein